MSPFFGGYGEQLLVGTSKMLRLTTGQSGRLSSSVDTQSASISTPAANVEARSLQAEVQAAGTREEADDLRGRHDHVQETKSRTVAYGRENCTGSRATSRDRQQSEDDAQSRAQAWFLDSTDWPHEVPPRAELAPPTVGRTQRQSCSSDVPCGLQVYGTHFTRVTFRGDLTWLFLVQSWRCSATAISGMAVIGARGRPSSQLVGTRRTGLPRSIAIAVATVRSRAS